MNNKIKHINDIKVRNVDSWIEKVYEEEYQEGLQWSNLISEEDERFVIHIEKKEESLFDWYLRKCEDISILDELFN